MDPEAPGAVPGPGISVGLAGRLMPFTRGVNWQHTGPAKMETGVRFPSGPNSRPSSSVIRAVRYESSPRTLVAKQKGTPLRTERLWVQVLPGVNVDLWMVLRPRLVTDEQVVGEIPTRVIFNPLSSVDRAGDF